MKPVLAAIVPLLAAGCAPVDRLPSAPALIAPADPATARPAPPGPAVAYSAHEITEPGDWRGLNDAQSGGRP